MATLRLTTRNVALICCFTPLYALFSPWSLFPIFGAAGKFITLATVMAPLMGIMLGPSLGVLTVALGGIVGMFMGQMGPFGPASFIPGASAALCSGLLYKNKRQMCALLYSVLLVIFAFYPNVGPAWLYPYFLWLHLLGLAVLVSPLQLKSVKFVRNPTKLSELALGLGTISFTSTLFSHLIGSTMFEMIYWPLVIPETSSWRTLWQGLTLVYPVERAIIVMMSTFIGSALIKALNDHGFEMEGREIQG